MPRRAPVLVSSIPDLLDAVAARSPDALAVVFGENRLTYGQLADHTDRIARGLMALGVGPGDRVALLLTNSLDMYTHVFAALKVGAVAVPVNSRFKSTELRHVIRHCGAKVLVTTTTDPAAPDLVGLLEEAFPGLGLTGTDAHLPELQRIVLLGDNSRLPHAVSAADLGRLADGIDPQALDRAAAAVAVRSPAFLVYTSGTTAAPKGAVLSHEALVRSARCLVDERLFMTPTDRLWTAIPLFHGGGLTFAVTCMAAGAALVHAGQFDAAATRGISSANGSRSRSPVSRRSGSRCWTARLRGAGPVRPARRRDRRGSERLRQMAARVPQAVQISTVAMTESTAYLCLGRLDDPYEARMTTGGQPVVGMQCRVTDPDSGATCPPARPASSSSADRTCSTATSATPS